MPRFYLEHFKDQNGFVWTYDSRAREPWPASPGNTGVISNFYSIEQEDGAYNDDIEAALNTIETAAAPLHDRVIDGEVLQGNEREDYVAFLVTQHLRSPVMVNGIANATAQTVQRATRAAVGDRDQFERQMDRMDAERGTTTSPTDRDKVFEAMTTPGRLKMTVAQQHGLMALSFAADIIPLVLRMRWNVFETTGRRLVTSDNPVVKYVPSDARWPIYGDGGFIHPQLEISFPLNPFRILMLHHDRSLDQGGIGRMYDEAVKRLNRRRAMNSERYLFGSERNAGLQSLATKFDGYKPRLRVGNGRSMFPIEVVRKIGR